MVGWPSTGGVCCCIATESASLVPPFKKYSKVAVKDAVSRIGVVLPIHLPAMISRANGIWLLECEAT